MAKVFLTAAGKAERKTTKAERPAVKKKPTMEVALFFAKLFFEKSGFHRSTKSSYTGFVREGWHPRDKH